MNNYFKELAEINNSFDNNDYSKYDRLIEINNDLEKSINISYILQLKKELINFNHEQNSTLFNIIEWISNNLIIEYIDLFSNILENIIVCSEIRYKLYDCYEKIIKKENNNDKIIAKYLIFLMKHNDLIQIHKVLNTSDNFKVNCLGELCYNLLLLLTIENHQDAWKIPDNIINNLLIKLNNINDNDLILSKEFLSFQITHMFKIYFEANTKNYCINISKCMYKFLPCLKYTSPYIYNHQLIKKERLKIGFLSLYFHNYHSVFTCFSGNLLVNLNDMDIYTFFVGNPDSEITKKFAQSVSNPVFITSTGNINISDVEVIRDTISSYQLDILVYPEIAESSLIYYTAFSRLAPIQITTIGHCDTSGLDNIDYYISSKLFEPHNAQEYYSEKLIQLNNLITFSIPIYVNTSYNPKNLGGWIVDNTPFLSRENICKNLDIDSNKILLHCIQTEYKLSIRFLKVLKNILELNPNAILLLKKPHSIYSHTYELLIEQYIPKNQYKYISWYQRYDYFNLIHISDIVLIPFPFGGYCTALDVLQMGKPTVTLEGNKLMGRMCAGFYKYMNIIDPIAHNDYEYIDIANKLCKNKEYRDNLSSRIINNSYKLFNNRDSVEEFYTTLKAIYYNISS